jgi:hypothetical protein
MGRILIAILYRIFALIQTFDFHLLSFTGILLSFTATVLLFLIALKNWQYKRELTKARISLHDQKVERNRKNAKKVNLTFFFKNSGLETAVITHIETHIIQLSTGDSEKLESGAKYYPIPGGGIFRYIIGRTLKAGINEEIYKTKLGGRIAILFFVTFKGTSSFSKKAITIPYLLSYFPPESILPLSEPEYEKLKGLLPEVCQNIEQLMKECTY